MSNSRSDNYSLIETIPECRSVTKKLSTHKVLAIDLEGVNLCREGKICIIQIKGDENPVYLIDVTAMGRTCFGEGGMKDLLESESVIKVFYDARGDCDSLLHQYGIKTKGVYDLQVLHCLKFSSNGDLYLKGLNKALEKYLSSSDYHDLDALKKKGLSLYASECGGDPNVWDKRPLPEILMEYAAIDVTYLLGMYKTWDSDGSKSKQVMEISSGRNIKYSADYRGYGKHCAIRDFKIGTGGYSVPDKKTAY